MTQERPVRIVFDVKKLCFLIESAGGVRSVVELLKKHAPSHLAMKRQTVYLWARGDTSPSSDVLPYLALALGCDSIDDLFNFNAEEG